MTPQRRLYARVGMLVLAGFLLAAGFVVFLTANIFGARVVIYETYIRESVQGLDLGAPVKFRGVALGHVTEIGLVSATYPAPADQSFVDAFQLVLVRFDLDLERLQDGVPDLREAIDHGLRVRLASQGLTGLAYLEMDFLPAQRFPVVPPPWRAEYGWVPSVPSTVAQVQNAAQVLLSRLENIDFAEVFRDVASLTEAVRHQVSEGDLAQTLSQAAILMRRLNEPGPDGADLAGLVAELRGMATEARGLLAGRELRGAIANAGAAGAEIRNAAARLPASLATLEATLRTARGATGDLQADLAPILRDLRSTVANLRDTTELLRRYPSQAVFGAPPPGGR